MPSTVYATSLTDMYGLVTLAVYVTYVLLSMGEHSTIPVLLCSENTLVEQYGLRILILKLGYMA